MKFLALILLPVMAFAQSEAELLRQETGHLMDPTNPVKKSDHTEPESQRSISSNKKVNYVSYCAEKSAGVKDVQWKYDEALRDCVHELHKEKELIGFKDCNGIASQISDATVRLDVSTTCDKQYGYEGCMESGQQTPKDCLAKYASSLSLKECKAELEKNGLSKDKESQKLCTRRSVASKKKSPGPIAK